MNVTSQLQALLNAAAAAEGYPAASPTEARANNPFGIMGGPNLGWNVVHQPSGTTYLQVFPSEQQGVQAALAEWQNNPRYSGAFASFLQTGNAPAFIAGLERGGWAGTPTDSPNWVNNMTALYSEFVNGRTPVLGGLGNAAGAAGSAIGGFFSGVGGAASNIVPNIPYVGPAVTAVKNTGDFFTAVLNPETWKRVVAVVIGVVLVIGGVLVVTGTKPGDIIGDAAKVSSVAAA